EALEWLRTAADTSDRWIEDANRTPVDQTLWEIIEGYAAYLDALQPGTVDKATLFQALNRFRVLCAVRDGPRGVSDINTFVSRRYAAMVSTLTFDAAVDVFQHYLASVGNAGDEVRFGFCQSSI